MAIEATLKPRGRNAQTNNHTQVFELLDQFGCLSLRELQFAVWQQSVSLPEHDPVHKSCANSARKCLSQLAQAGYVIPVGGRDGELYFKLSSKGRGYGISLGALLHNNGRPTFDPNSLLLAHRRLGIWFFLAARNSPWTAQEEYGMVAPAPVTRDDLELCTRDTRLYWHEAKELSQLRQYRNALDSQGHARLEQIEELTLKSAFRKAPDGYLYNQDTRELAWVEIENSDKPARARACILQLVRLLGRQVYPTHRPTPALPERIAGAKPLATVSHLVIVYPDEPVASGGRTPTDWRAEQKLRKLWAQGKPAELRSRKNGARTIADHARLLVASLVQLISETAHLDPGTGTPRVPVPIWMDYYLHQIVLVRVATQQAGHWLGSMPPIPTRCEYVTARHLLDEYLTLKGRDMLAAMDAQHRQRYPEVLDDLPQVAQLDLGKIPAMQAL